MIVIADRTSVHPILLSGLAEMAQRRLRASPYAAVRNVSCECRHGVLVLRGRLPSYYHKQVAQEAVARLDGISWVVNEIEVASQPRLPSTWDLTEG